MNKNINKPVGRFLIHALAIGVGAFLAQNAHSQGVVYQNNSTFSGNFEVDNAQAGNEIILAGPQTADNVTQLQFQFDLINSGASPLSGSPTGSEEVELTLYKNDGPIVSGYHSPGTVLYQSGFSTMSSIGLTSFSQGQTLTFNPNVTVPQDFTWAVTFANIPTSESAGLSIFNGVAGPTVGNNYGDAWYNSGTWTLDVAKPNNPSLQFGATVTAVPEPSTIALAVMGISSFLVRRRKI